MSGFVSLVGAGPGRSDLLTMRAIDRLRRADLVLYDALVDPSVLELVQGRRFYVGKRAGRHSMGQDTLCALLVRHAREGLHVVRLKAGDPFVLGRGGEEAMALEAAQIRYEVVPGVSSATSAPALAGIPVTHRGASSAVVTVSGHHPDAFGPLLSALPPDCATVVVLMGHRQRAAIAHTLLARRWSGATPAAMIAGASTPDQRVWRGQLADLGAEGFDPGPLPVTLVVGRVAALDLSAPSFATSSTRPEPEVAS
jgi:uroporphyrin-III C-methyltransferase/precorrin-2 dehydrogenase/sirohydrochlorin ferrochelatase